MQVSSIQASFALFTNRKQKLQILCKVNHGIDLEMEDGELGAFNDWVDEVQVSGVLEDEEHGLFIVLEELKRANECMRSQLWEIYLAPHCS
jgi:hypothetical protein